MPTALPRLIAGCLPLLLAACTAASGPAPPLPIEPPLQGDWRVIGLSGIDLPADYPEVAGTVRLQFSRESSRIQGFNGCNRFFGRFDDQQGLQISEVGASKRYCPATAALESALMTALGQVGAHRQVDGELQLLGADQRPLLRLLPSAGDD